MSDPIRVALIDDDEAVLDSLRLYLKRKGVAASCFPAAETFLATGDIAGQFDCIVTDVRMPGISGLDLVRQLSAQGKSPPIILITGHGDVEMAVGAIKLGAADFIEKPFDEARLLESISTAVENVRTRRDESEELSDLRARAAGLSQRQREVMELAAAGMSNKEIAAQLKISPRTVEIHRAWMMERMSARNVAELVRIVMRLGARD